MTPKLVHLAAIKEILVNGKECLKIVKRDTLNCFSNYQKVWSAVSLETAELIAGAISVFGKKFALLDHDSGEIRNGVHIPLIRYTNFTGIENCDTVCVILKKQNEYFAVSILSQLITGSKEVRYICSQCKQFVAKDRHECFQPVCRACGLNVCGGGGYDTLFRHQCGECLNYFFDADCLAAKHKTKDWCLKNTFCTKCTFRYSREKGVAHVCGEIQCQNCYDFFHPTVYHSCQMWKKFTPDQIDNLGFTPPAFTRVKKPLGVFGVYDFETACLHNSEQQVVCAQILIGGKSYISWSIQEFLLQLLCTEFDGKHFYAHNGAKFDALFVMSGVAEMAKNQAGFDVEDGKLHILANNSIINGRKMLYVEISYIIIPNTKKRKKVTKKKIYLRDSCLLFALPLSKFAPAMGVTQQKSFFPYKLNVNLLTGNIIIPKPSKEIFEPAQRSNPDFDSWYDLLPETFNVKEELEKYCLIDVEVLYKCLEKFQQCFLAFSGGIDPLTFKTAASFAQNVFLSMFAPTTSPGKTSISVLTSIRVNEKSDAENEYIRFLIHENPSLSRDKYDFKSLKKSFKHSVNFYDEDRDILTVYSFRSCFENGHQCSSRNDKKKSIVCDNEFKEFKTELCDETEIMYECQWKEFKQKNPELESMWLPDNFGDADGINVFKINGGVVEVYASKYSCDETEEILCYDVVSEYPSVQCFCPYPIGPVFYHRFSVYGLPAFIQAMNESTALLDLVRDMKTDKPIVVKYFGVFHVKVLPPKDLEHPVIPGDWNGKRYFATCSKCAFTENQGECVHTDKERAWWVTLTTMDIILAIDNEYIILDIYEGWFFKESCVNWDGDDYTLKEDCFLLFKEYVDKLMILKKESGENGNKTLRTISKLLLNSLWGKLGQRNSYKGRSIIFHSDHNSYNEIVDDPALSTLKLDIFPDFIMTTYDYDAGHNKYQINPFTNHIVANFVTSYGRSKLLSGVKSVNSVGHKVLYVDTDSITFVRKINNNTPIPNFPIGSGLGEWESEADKVYDRRVDEFIAIGRKAYVWGGRTPEGVETLKVRTKGISPPLLGVNVEKDLKFKQWPIEARKQGFQYFSNILETQQSLILTGVQFQSNSTLAITINDKYEKKMSLTIRHRKFFKSGLTVPFGSKIKE
jgi:hypothetical protein